MFISRLGVLWYYVRFIMCFPTLSFISCACRKSLPSVSDESCLMYFPPSTQLESTCFPFTAIFRSLMTTIRQLNDLLCYFFAKYFFINYIWRCEEGRIVIFYMKLTRLFLHHRYLRQSFHRCDSREAQSRIRPPCRPAFLGLQHFLMTRVSFKFLFFVCLVLPLLRRIQIYALLLVESFLFNVFMNFADYSARYNQFTSVQRHYKNTIIIIQLFEMLLIHLKI